MVAHPALQVIQLRCNFYAIDTGLQTRPHEVAENCRSVIRVELLIGTQVTLHISGGGGRGCRWRGGFRLVLPSVSFYSQARAGMAPWQWLFAHVNSA